MSRPRAPLVLEGVRDGQRTLPGYVDGDEHGSLIDFLPLFGANWRREGSESQGRIKFPYPWLSDPSSLTVLTLVGWKLKRARDGLLRTLLADED